MNQSQGTLTLAAGMDQSGMTFEEAWLRQASIGGDLAQLELEAYILGLLTPDPHCHDLIAQAINEHFIDEGGDHPVAYHGQNSITER